MEPWLAAIPLLLVLWLIAGRQPGSVWLYAVAFALTLVVMIVGAERAGLWPDAWRR